MRSTEKFKRCRSGFATKQSNNKSPVAKDGICLTQARVSTGGKEPLVKLKLSEVKPGTVDFSLGMLVMPAASTGKQIYEPIMLQMSSFGTQYGAAGPFVFATALSATW